MPLENSILIGNQKQQGANRVTSTAQGDMYIDEFMVYFIRDITWL